MAYASARKTNWFAIWVSAAVVVALIALAAIVVTANMAASPSGPEDVPTASNVDQETGAITFGDGPDTVSTYVDFMCPYCRQFEQAEGTTLQQLVADGEITLQVYPVTILDRASLGSQYSSRAASAMYAVAVADPSNAYAFLTALYANQPQENTQGLTNEQIVQVAKDAGVDVTDELEQQILGNEYTTLAQSLSLPEGATGTPAVAVNGDLIQVTFDPQADIVARLG